ncbi:MAG: PAS domain S-box protein [Bacteroidetes bacterium]|nr:PAS domain S-box protein [Bacteroidota bacterium]MBL6943024.1 PAS domain S-box protein [Bacteroidales bacterium]
MEKSNTALIKLMQSFSRITGIAVFLVGCLVILGWILDVTALKNIFTNFVSMKMNTAVCFALAGASLFILTNKNFTQRLGFLSQFFAAIIVLIGTLTLIEYFFSLNLGIDQLLISEQHGAVGTAFPGRMAVQTAFNFMLVGLSLLLLHKNSNRAVIVAQFFSLAILLVGFLVLIGYIYNISGIISISYSSDMALQTALTFELISLGILSFNPERGFVKYFSGADASSLIIRQLLPAIILIPLVVEILVTLGIKTGLYTIAEEPAFHTLIIILVLILIIWRSVLSLKRTEGERKFAELQLSNSEQQYRSIIQTSMDGFWICDTEGHILDVNDAYCQLIGYEREELLKMRVPDVEMNETPEETAQHIQEVITKGYVRFETRHRRKDGQILEIEVSTVYGTDPEGGRLFIFLRDITERKLSEEKLKQIEWMLSKHSSISVTDEGLQNSPSDQGYGDLTELNTDGIILKSVGKEILSNIVSEYLNLLDTSSAVYEKNGDYAFGIFSSKLCRLMDSASRKLCNTDDNAEALNSGNWLCHESCWTCCSKESMTKRVPVDIECNGGIRLYAIPIFAGEDVIGSINFGYGDPPRDPVKIKEIANLYKLDYDELLKEASSYNSRPTYIIDMAKNRLHASAKLIGILVERKLAEEQISIITKRLELATESAQIGIWDYDIKENALLWDKRMYELYGIQPEDFGGAYEAWEKGLHPDDLITARTELQDAIAGKKDFHTQFRVVWPGGQVRFIEAHAVVQLASDGSPHHITGVNWDITERKRAEENLQKTLNDLERSNNDLQQFAYVASHDLQEPLRMVSSYTQLLERRYKDKLDQDANDFMNYAVDGANRMQKLINDMLDYSRVTTKGKEFHPIDTNSALGQAIVNLQQKIQSTSALITNEELPVIIADEGQIIRLFQNLIGNAIKYAGDETSRIHISCNDLPDLWQFSVQDNGIGIAEEFNERIFVIFQRLHSGKDYPGTGIGLAICKRIAERHGGKIWIEPAPDKGTIFHFTILKRSKSDEYDSNR